MKRWHFTLFLCLLLCAQMSSVVAQNEIADDNRQQESNQDRNPLDDQDGPDPFGYHYVDNQNSDSATYAWIESDGSWTELTTLSANDEGNELINLSTPFPFYGMSYSTARVHVNGLITFTTGSNDWSNECTLPATLGLPSIFVFWDDLHAESGASSDAGRIVWRNFGDHYVITWDSVGAGISSSETNLLDFQAILYADGRIKCQYRHLSGWDVDFQLPTGTLGIQAGSAQPTYNLLYDCNLDDFDPVQEGLTGRAVWYLITTPSVHDFGCTALLAPVGDIVVESNFSVSARFTNFGSTTELAPVYYRFNGGTIVNEATGSVASTEFEDHMFAGTITAPLTPGLYSLDVWCSLTEDEHPENDTIHAFVNVATLGRCCYEDNICCAINTENECNVLGGVWTFGEDCGVPCNALCDIVQGPFDIIEPAESDTCGFGFVDPNGNLSFGLPISCGDTVFSRVYWYCDMDEDGYGDFSDLDLYRIAIPGPESASITFGVTMERGGFSYFIRRSNAQGRPGQIIGFLSVPECATTYTFTQCLIPGSYFFQMNNPPGSMPKCATLENPIEYRVWANCEPCPGRCCYFDGAPQCELTTLEECDNLGGEWTDGEDCSLPCPVGRCCYGEDICIEDVTGGECAELGGQFAEGETCATAPCITNDDCGSAMQIELAPNDITSVFVNNTYADHTCEGICSDGTSTGPDQFFTFTLTECRRISIYTTGGDSHLSLYENQCCGAPLLCNDGYPQFDATGLIWITHFPNSGSGALIADTLFPGTYFLRAGNGDDDIDESYALYFVDYGSCLFISDCDSVEDLTVTVVTVDNAANNLKLNWTAPQDGNYVVWSTSNPANDGDPNSGTDSDFEIEDLLNGLIAGPQEWMAPEGFDEYKQFVVTYGCSSPVSPENSPTDACPGGLLTGHLPLTITGNTTYATNDFNVQDIGIPNCWGGTFFSQEFTCAGRDVCFRWIAPAAGSYIFSTCNSEFNADVLVYNYTCPNLPDNNTDLLCGSDAACGFNGVRGETPPVDLAANQQVLIVLDARGDNYGNYELTISDAGVLPTGRCCYNDGLDCQSDITLFECDDLSGDWTEGEDCNNPCPTAPVIEACPCSLLTGTLPIVVNGNNADAVSDFDLLDAAGEPECWGGSWWGTQTAQSSDHCFRWTVPAAGNYVFQTCGSNYDTGLLIYNYTCPNPPDNATDLICGSEDFCGIYSQTPPVPLSADQEILIVVDGWDNWVGGAYTLTISAP